MEIWNNYEVVINNYKNCLVVTLPGEFTEEAMATMRDRIPENIQENDSIGIVLDFSPVCIMDMTEFEYICNIASTAEILGARPVFVGLKPGIVSALIDMNADIDGIEARLNMEDGVNYILGEKI